MKVGKLLKEKAGFDNPETVTRFINRFGYSEVIFNKILNDQFPVLLTCHIEDLSLFTGFSVTELIEAQELTTDVDILRMHVPMGKPYVAEPPVAATIDVRIEIPDLQEAIAKRYGGCTKLEQEEDLPVHKVSVMAGERGAEYLLAAMGPDGPMLVNQYGERVVATREDLIPTPVTEIKSWIPPSQESIDEVNSILKDVIDGKVETAPLDIYGIANRCNKQTGEKK